MFLLFLQSNVSVNFDELSQLIGSHLVVSFLRCSIRALNAMHRYAVRSQHAFDFRQHCILLFKTDVTDNVKTNDVIKAVISERQMREFCGRGEVVAVSARGL